MNQRTSYERQRHGLEDEIQKQFGELQKHRPNILVVGRTGAGKSSLINTALGEKLAVTGAGRPITQSYEVFQHPLVTMIDSKGWEGGAEGEQRFREDTARLLKDRRTTNPDDHIHIVWYAVSAPDARFEDFEAQLVREAFGGIPVLFVLTKCDIVAEDALVKVEQVIKTAATTMAQQATKNAPAPRIVGIIRISADPLPLLRQAPWGMDVVVEMTRDELPALYRDAFDAAQSVDFSLKARKAQAVVIGAAATAGTIGLIPIPFSDSVLLTPLQVSMVTTIAIIYGFGADPGSLTALIGGSIAPLAAESVGATLAGNLLKLFPGAGSILGGVIEGTVASTITATIGYGFQRAFHQLALRQAKGNQDMTIEGVGQFLKQALPSLMEEIRQRGVKNVLPDGSDA